MIPETMKEQYWLAKLDRYGNPRLMDGSHGDLENVRKALALYKMLGFSEGHYAAVKVTILEDYDEGV